MKKLLSMLLALAMILSMTAFASADPLTATVAGFGGDVTVSVELDADGVITANSADGSTQTPELGGAAATKLTEAYITGLPSASTMRPFILVGCSLAHKDKQTSDNSSEYKNLRFI